MDEIVKSVFAIGTKSNTFYKEDVEKVLSEMIGTVTPGKCIMALRNTGMRHKSGYVHRILSHSLFNTVKQYGAEYILKQLPRDVLEKLLSDMASLLMDADVGARFVHTTYMYVHVGTCTIYPLVILWRCSCLLVN